MIVFFTCSYKGKAQYQEQYDLIVKTIEGLHVTLISPEQRSFQEEIEAKAKELHADPNLLKNETIKQGIHTADAVVMETSVEEFQLGHETTIALMEKKPVLCLSRTEDFGKRIDNEYFFGTKYTPETLESILQDFFAKVRDLSLSKRFNLFLSPYQVEYLETMSKKFGMNMSEYIRRLINLDRRSLLRDYQEAAWPKEDKTI